MGTAFARVSSSSSSISSNNSSGGGGGGTTRSTLRPPTRRSRSVDDIHDAASVLEVQQRQSIERTAARIRQRGLDVNVFLVAPATIGGSDFCSVFEEFTEDVFRYVDIVTTTNADSGVARSYSAKINTINANRSAALDALASVIQREEIHARRPGTSRSGGAGGDGGGASTPQLPNGPPADMASAAQLYYNSELLRAQYILDTERSLQERRHSAWAQRPRMRIYCGSALDASLVPQHARPFLPLFDQLGWQTLQQTADMVWSHYTRLCPVTSMIFVYIHYTDDAFETAYDAYATRRIATKDERELLQALRPLHTANKWSADRLYFTGQSNVIVKDYYVLVFTCTSAVLTSALHQAFITDEILKTVDQLQTLDLWGPEAVEEDRARYMDAPAWRSGRVKSVPDSLLPEPVVRRRNSLEGCSHQSLPKSESRSGSRIVGKEKERASMA